MFTPRLVGHIQYWYTLQHTAYSFILLLIIISACACMTKTVLSMVCTVPVWLRQYCLCCGSTVLVYIYMFNYSPLFTADCSPNTDTPFSIISPCLSISSYDNQVHLNIHCVYAWTVFHFQSSFYNISGYLWYGVSLVAQIYTAAVVPSSCPAQRRNGKGLLWRTLKSLEKSQ